jgi:aldose 1-epimerase
MQSHLFGRMPDGTAVHAFTLGRAGGLSATVIQYGARLAALEVPVAAGTRNIVLGHAEFAPYLADHAHLGAVAGRYANRIAGARFVLDGREVRLPANNGANTLHGGPMGFGKQLWEAAPEGEDLLLTLTSADGDQGFPGRLEVSVLYRVEGDTLSIDYEARTDAPTVINLTNHAYFNLAGAGTVLDHRLSIPAEAFLPVDAALIPTGERRPVAGTPFDFRTPTPIGARIEADDEQLRLGRGYDHCFILADAPRATVAPAARLEGGGIALEVLTTEPAVQFYSGNGLDGAPFAQRTGLCLETQHFPDSPNHPDFPTTVLRPGETFRSRTALRCLGTDTA